MKRLLLASLLCVVAVIIAPVASASANPEAVKCEFKGTAKFNPALSPKPTPATYEFESEGAGNNCEGATVKKAEASSAKVKGKGELSCTVSPGLGVTGLAKFESGSLKAGSRAAFTLSRFEFAGAGPVVKFAAEGSNGPEEFKGGGQANFLSTPTALLECEAGVLSSVVFTATSAGVVK
jgi:hypothetical protein